VDLVIAVGGDGTILHVASLFEGVRAHTQRRMRCVLRTDAHLQSNTNVLLTCCPILMYQEAPPILAFCKGTLGFLTPFRTCSLPVLLLSPFVTQTEQQERVFDFCVVVCDL
jgi:NAD kinase